MIPSMTTCEAACYERHLAGAHAVLEYGVGGSTILAAERGVESLYCAETDAAWLDKVREHPAVAAMVNAGKATLVHVDIGPIGRWGKPKDKWRFYGWPAYARRPWRDGFAPDLVLVDGRFRVSCIMQSLRGGGPGTKIAVHDFWPRAHYHPVLAFAAPIDRAGTMVVLQGNGQERGPQARLLDWRHLYSRR